MATLAPDQERRLRAAAQSLLQDAATAELGRRLAEAAVPVVLLKGPTFARWLYDRAELRTYVDSDLLVPRRRFREAGRVLRRAGFRPTRFALTWRHAHAVSWTRARDGAHVDLHHSLWGIDREVDPWPVLVHRTEPVEVAGTTLPGLDEGARCLQAAIHAGTGRGTGKPQEDLRRAIGVASRSSWDDALALAEALDCVAAVAAGLSRVPEGRALATSLGVPAADGPIVDVVDAEGPDRTWALLTIHRSWRGRLGMLVQGVCLPRAELRDRYPWARGPLVGAARACHVATRARYLVEGRRRARDRAGTVDLG